MINRRGLKVKVDTKRQRILQKMWDSYGGAATQQALTIRAQLLRVDDTDSEQVAFLTDLYNRAVKGEDVLRLYPYLRIFPIDSKLD